MNDEAGDSPDSSGDFFIRFFSGLTDWEKFLVMPLLLTYLIIYLSMVNYREEFIITQMWENENKTNIRSSFEPRYKAVNRRSGSVRPTIIPYWILTSAVCHHPGSASIIPYWMLTSPVSHLAQALTLAYPSRADLSEVKGRTLKPRMNQVSDLTAWNESACIYRILFPVMISMFTRSKVKSEGQGVSYVWW